MSNGRILPTTGRAASTRTREPRDDVRITEVLNGLIVTRPAKKLHRLIKPEQQETQEPESVAIEIGSSRTGSYVPRRYINPVKEMFDFLRSNGRI